MTKQLPIAAMSVDVEEYFQVAAFEQQVTPNEWSKYPSRVESQMDDILQVFDDKSVKATFFVLSSVAQKHPQLVRRIVQAGHELASHGHMHQKADRQTPDEFRQDIQFSKELLESISGQAVLGYRAPSFSINTSNEWAFEVLRDAGFVYSSSTYPIAHDHYGTPDWPRVPFNPVPGLLEIPQSTIDVCGRALPIGGGGYFRLFPYALSRWAITKHQQTSKTPYMFYFHPWEIDPEQPKVAGASLKSAFRHYVNQGRMLNKISKMSELATWRTIAEAFHIDAAVSAQAPWKKQA